LQRQTPDRHCDNQTLTVFRSEQVGNKNGLTPVDELLTVGGSIYRGCEYDITAKLQLCNMLTTMTMTMMDAVHAQTTLGLGGALGWRLGWRLGVAPILLGRSSVCLSTDSQASIASPTQSSPPRSSPCPPPEQHQHQH
jgi:hypothetical protein